ncbi:MAG TPA: efflux RND transporter permease subunit [bacterium]|nr:efflux RND transporter permease subunit [bacterium]
MATAFLTLMLVSLGMTVFFVPPLIATNSSVFKPKVAGTRLLWKILLYHRRFPVGGLTAAAVLTLLVPFAFFHLPKGFSEGIEDPIIFAQVEFPSGTQAAFVDSRLSWLSSEIAAIKGVERVESMARRTKGTLSVRFNPKRISRVELEDLLDEYNDFLYQGFLFVHDRGSTAKEIVIDLIGPDDRYLRVAARRLAAQFSAQSWVRQSVLHFKAGEPRLILDIDHSRAQAAGVDPAVAAASLRWGLFGPVIVKWIDAEGEMDVRVMGSEELFNDVSSIRKSGVINDRGQYVSLESIGNFETSTEPGRIYRLNRQRSVSMSIQTTLPSLDAIVQNVETVLANFPLKKGHGFRIDPALERSTKQYRLLGFSLVIAAFLVFLILAAQYESLTAPLIIILSIPVSLACPLFVLTITGSSLTFPSLVGMIVVTGLVVNNTILLVDDMLFQRKKYGGISTWQALRHALRKRFRPLVLTTGSTLLGLVPLFLSWGAASGMLHKLAFTVFWGILGSALAALFILPGVFLFFPALTKRWPELSKS